MLKLSYISRIGSSANLFQLHQSQYQLLIQVLHQHTAETKLIFVEFYYGINLTNMHTKKSTKNATSKLCYSK